MTPHPPSRAGKQPRTQSSSAGEATPNAGGLADSNVGEGGGKARSPRRSNNTVNANKFKEARAVRDMVAAISKQKKIFTLFGRTGYADDIRQGLLRRGWIERPPPRETDV